MRRQRYNQIGACNQSPTLPRSRILASSDYSSRTASDKITERFRNQHSLEECTNNHKVLGGRVRTVRLAGAGSH